MLTGELPIGRFAAPSKQVAVDVRLDEVVLRTLEKEPQRRYQRASQIKADVESISATENLGLAPTIVLGANAEEKLDVVADSHEPAAELQRQALAARLLVSRRELLARVRHSLSPLFRWQLLQILFGVLLIVLGAQCWAQNLQIPYRLICGVILHVYGIAVIAAGASVCARINRIDYARPTKEIRYRLDDVRRMYLRVGSVIGFPWWLMWIPAAVAMGFDPVVLYAASLVPSLVVGVVGFVASLWPYVAIMRSKSERAAEIRNGFAGRSLANASKLLCEIEKAHIE